MAKESDDMNMERKETELEYEQAMKSRCILSLVSNRTQVTWTLSIRKSVFELREPRNPRLQVNRNGNLHI